MHITLWVTPPTSPCPTSSCPTLSADAETIFSVQCAVWCNQKCTIGIFYRVNHFSPSQSTVFHSWLQCSLGNSKVIREHYCKTLQVFMMQILQCCLYSEHCRRDTVLHHCHQTCMIVDTSTNVFAFNFYYTSHQHWSEKYSLMLPFSLFSSLLR